MRGLRLSPHTENLEVDYTALSLPIPERARFRYKLEGGEGDDWQDAGTRRAAFFDKLTPGKYRFRVVASNGDGAWNEAGAFLDFSVPPAYYQTLWFRTLCVAVLLALLWTIFEVRRRQLLRQFNIGLEARVSERTRIARELHDTLLQSFQGVLYLFHSGVSLLPGKPKEAKERLENAVIQAQRAITEARDAVQGLRWSTIETNDLTRAINTLAEDLAAPKNGQPSSLIQVRAEGRPRDLHPILRDEVYRIAGEAIRNAVRHADANQIEVEIHYGEDQLSLCVRDDGKGMDSQVLTNKGRRGHWGLYGMDERAKDIGAKLELRSKLQSGTEIELTIPASIAYVPSVAQRRSWPSKKGSAPES
jgi:signal transduction histidine kinase